MTTAQRSATGVAVALALIGVGLVLSAGVLGRPDADLVLDAAVAWPDVPVADHRTLRPSVVLPLALLVRVFGPGLLPFQAVGVLGTAGLLGGTFVLGRQLLDRWWGVVGAAATLATPFLLTRTGEPSADVTAGALATWALVVAISSRDADAPQRARRLVLAGSLLALAALARVSVVPLVVVLVLAGRAATARDWGRLAGPLVAGGLVQVVHDIIVTGSPLARLVAILSHNRAGTDAVLTEGNSVADAAGGLPAALASLPPAPAWAVLLVAGVVLGLVTAWWDRRSRVLLAWVGVVWLVHLVTGGLLGDEATFVQGWVPRLWLPVWPAFVLLPLVGVDAVARRTIGEQRATTLRGRAGLPAAALATVLAVAVGAYGWDLDPPLVVTRDRSELATLRTWFAATDARVALVDERSGATVRFATRTPLGGPVFGGDLVIVGDDTALPDLPDAVALVDATNPPGTARRLKRGLLSAGWRRAEVVAGFALFEPPGA